jgi:hypothetical protein
MQKYEQTIFSNLQLQIKLYVILTIATSKKSNCSHTTVLINTNQTDHILKDRKWCSRGADYHSNHCLVAARITE